MTGLASVGTVRGVAQCADTALYLAFTRPPLSDESGLEGRAGRANRASAKASATCGHFRSFRASAFGPFGPRGDGEGIASRPAIPGEPSQQVVPVDQSAPMR